MEIIDYANLKYKFSSIYFYNSGHFLGKILIFVLLVFARLEKSKKFNLFLNNLLLAEPFCLEITKWTGNRMHQWLVCQPT